MCVHASVCLYVGIPIYNCKHFFLLPKKALITVESSYLTCVGVFNIIYNGINIYQSSHLLLKEKKTPVQSTNSYLLIAQLFFDSNSFRAKAPLLLTPIRSLPYHQHLMSFRHIAGIPMKIHPLQKTLYCIHSFLVGSR